MTESVPNRSIVKIFFHACQSRSVRHYWKLRLRARRRRADRAISLSGSPFVQFAIDFSPEIAAYKGSAARAKSGMLCADARRALQFTHRAGELGATKSAAISQVANERRLYKRQQQTPGLLSLAEFADEQSVVAGARHLQERREIRHDEHQPHHHA